MSELRKFEFEDIYSYISLIENHVYSETSFWNYNQDYFIENSIKFSKETLLHQYIVCTLLNYYRKNFRKSNWYDDEEALDFFYEKFSKYNIKIPKYKERKNFDGYSWFIRHENKFQELFDNLSNEIFHILFLNRDFLLNFNLIVAETVYELSSLYPEKYLTNKKTIKRVNIPQWVKNAVFHRDKGRCVFCSTDLTKLINTLKQNNYDHIVALDKNGANDPSNIQLTCETCNKKKSNGKPTTTNLYFSWW